MGHLRVRRQQRVPQLFRLSKAGGNSSTVRPPYGDAESVLGKVITNDLRGKLFIATKLESSNERSSNAR